MSITRNCLTDRRRKNTPAVATCCNLRKPSPDLQRALKKMMLAALKQMEKDRC